MNRFRVWLLAAMGSLVCVAPALATTPTGWVQVSATNTISAGVVIANATINFSPVNNNGQAISFRVGASGGGQVGPMPFTALVIKGAFTLLVPDTALTSPANVCYNVTIVDNVTGNLLTAAGYTCVQPTANNSWCASQVCNFDSYPPSLPPNATIGYVVSINGVSGAWQFSGGGITCNTTTLTCAISGSSGGSAGDSDMTGQTASQATVNLVGTVSSTGKYRISYYADQNALCSTGSVSVLFTFNWTDGSHARSVKSIALTLGTAQAASSSIQGVIPAFAAASSAITYTSTVSGSCATGGPASYDAHISVEAVQ